MMIDIGEIMNNEYKCYRTRDMEEIATRLTSERKKFLEKVEAAVRDTLKFSTSISSAIGEISITEAKEGIINFFVEQIKK